jgi:hypothetical protein
MVALMEAREDACRARAESEHYARRENSALSDVARITSTTDEETKTLRHEVKYLEAEAARWKREVERLAHRMSKLRVRNPRDERTNLSRVTPEDALAWALEKKPPATPAPPSWKPGCCVDRSCNPDTCMRLPPGCTCGDCLSLERCKALFGCQSGNTTCDRFPRQFVHVRRVP